MDSLPAKGRWWREWPAALIILIVGLSYLSRLSTLPVVGEEGRWARGAVQMVETGDWIVPRQQGQVFPERPPMSSWAMAVVGLLRGEVDVVAIRLPSVLAVLATSVLVYAYSRAFMGQLGAFAAALVYATFGQVLQIGRHGESEALFTLFLSASVLLWHYGYARRWSSTRVWLVGYVCMALAALVKGPQAPAYFGAITICYTLVVQRDWSFIFSWSHLIGIGAAAAIVGAWQIPFYLMTDWQSVVATWTGLAGDRFEIRGLVSHVVLYPLETFACLLPWSPLLVALASRKFRASLANTNQLTTFLVTAFVVTYPSVWFASAARGRYFMPLYPLIAVLLGLIIERCVAAEAATWGRLNWRNFLLGSSIAATGGSLAVFVASLVEIDVLKPAAQPIWFAALLLAVAVVVAVVLLWCRERISGRTAQAAVATLAAFAGLAYTGAVINVHTARWNDPSDQIAQIREALPASAKLVSFGPVDFRFCYHFRERVRELPWPGAKGDVPAGVEYFCIDRHPGDTSASRSSGRGRSWEMGPGSLPFEWEEVGRVCVERRIRDRPQPEVIVARIKPRQPLTAMSKGASSAR